MRLNLDARNFRLFSPDENNSNRWQDVLEVTDRAWMAETFDYDDHLAPDGRVMEMLSEHQCQGWLEGYLLTGRHGFFSCYEAFIHIVDSMFNQHAKWLKVCNDIPWRRPIASLNYLLSSHVWRQDHNGFSHQDPGFIDHVVNKKRRGRARLPAARRQLPAVGDRPLPAQPQLRERGRRGQAAGAAVADAWRRPIRHCAAGIGIWEWASNDRGGEPDVVMACCGDVPTLETLAAVDLLRRHAPDLKVRVINVVDLMRLQPAERASARSERPGLRRALHHRQADHLRLPRLSLADPPARLPARLTTPTCTCAATRRRARPRTPFDMCVMNDLDRFHLAGDVIDRVPKLGARAAYAKQAIRDKLMEHKAYICRHGIDMPESADWAWGSAAAVARSTEGDNV